MALPLAGIAVGLAANAITSPVTSFISSSWAPTDYRNREVAWFWAPIQKPDISAIIDGVNSGRIPINTAEWVMRCHGAFWVDRSGDEAGFLGRADDQIDGILERRDTFNLFANQAARDEYRQRLGDTSKAWDEVIKSRQAIPSIGMAVHLFTVGMIDGEEYQRIVKRNAGDVAAWNSIKNALYNPLDVSTLHEARNRGLIANDAAMDAGFTRLGFRLPHQVSILSALRERLPSTGELLDIARLQLWRGKDSALMGAFEDIPPELQEWMAKHGLYGNSGIVAHVGNNDREAKWGEVLWAASRTPLSVGEAIEAFRRHRPGRIERFNALGLAPAVFTIDRLDDTLLANGYAPYDRDTLAGLAYQPIPFRYVRTMLQLKTQVDNDPIVAAAMPPAIKNELAGITNQWAVENLVDLGHNPIDSALQVAVVVAQQKLKDIAPLIQFGHSELSTALHLAVEAYEAGIVTRAVAYVRPLELGASVASLDMAFDNVDIKRNIESAKSTTAQIHHDFDNGIVSAPEAMSALLLSGVVNEAAMWMLQRWTVELTHTRKTATASQVLTWLEQGLITRVDAVNRLNNLGYSQADEIAMLRSAQLEIDKLAVHQMAAVDKSRHQAAKQLALVAKQAEQQRKAAVVALRSKLPKSVLLASLRKGIVSPPYVQARLREQGYPEVEIDLLIRNALYEKPHKASVDTQPTQETAALPETGRAEQPVQSGPTVLHDLPGQAHPLP